MPELKMTTVPLVDAHCHIITDRRNKIPADNDFINNNNITRGIMSNNLYDWERLQKYSTKSNINSMTKQFIGFGIHPWYSHLFTFDPIDRNDPMFKINHYKNVITYKDTELSILENLVESILPDPIYIEDYINTLNFSKIDIIGEIGLDKSFTIPSNGFYQTSRDEDVTRTKLKVSMDHQLKIFERMLQLASTHNINVSLHDVNCHLKLFDLCKSILLQKDSNVNICLHSYTGSIEFLTTQWMKTFSEERIFLSVSEYINFKNNSPNLDFKQIPSSCILTETDYVIDYPENKNSLIQESLTNTLTHLTSTLELDNITDTTQLIYNNFNKFMHISK